MSKSERNQIGLTVTGNIKRVYDAAAGPGGLNATRIFQAGFLHLLTIPQMRRPALIGLQEFEEKGELTEKMAIDFVVGRNDLSPVELDKWIEKFLTPLSQVVAKKHRSQHRR